jgi:predicted PurR-regulated permease PerM
VKQSISLDFKSILLLLLAVGIGFVVVKIWNVILIILTAVVIATFMEAGTQFFARWKIPRVVSVIIMFVIGAAFLAVLFSVVVPVFLKELVQLADLFPAKSSIGQALLPFKNFISGTQGIKDIASGDTAGTISDIWTKFSGGNGFGAAGNVLGGLLNIILVVVISFYLAMTDRGVDRFLRVMTPKEYEVRVLRVWHGTEKRIALWFKGQVIAAFLAALLIYIGLLILGVPYALLIGFLVFICEFIPFGIILAAIPALVVALLGGGVSLFLLVLALFFVIQQFENYVLQPIIIKRIAGIPSLLVILALFVGVELLGLYGLFLAIPAVVLVLELISESNIKQEEMLP